MEFLENLQETIAIHTQGIPEELVVFLLSMIPFSESRGSIPFGIAALDMNPWEAFFWGVLGNITLIWIFAMLLPPVTDFFRRHWSWFDRLCERIFEKTRTRHSKRMSEVGHLALFLMAALPLPGTGGMSTILVAYLFGVKRWLAILLVSTGLVLNGLLFMFGTDTLLALLESIF